MTLSSEANSSITDLKQELETKSRDLDVIRECLIDLRGQVITLVRSRNNLSKEHWSPRLVTL